MANINFNPFPVLKTERLTLRQLSTADQHDIFALRSDIEINKYLDRAPSKTIDDALNFINQINDTKSFYWVISVTETQGFAGTICLFDFSTEKNSCEIGYELMTKFQGQGLMNEAAKAVIDYAFETLKFQQIVAYTNKENQNSTKLLTRLKFVENSDLGVFKLTPSPQI